ncbi:MAG: transglycosylase SLT domain-containing protein [Burkholderiales bacterium]|nr:transglycosylase SLT domain-containing protein [Burkholderiales bacterium]
MNAIKFIVTCILSLIIVKYSYANQYNYDKLALNVQTNLHTAIINPANTNIAFNDKDPHTDWVNEMSNRLQKWIPNELIRKRILMITKYEAERSGLDPQLVLSVITVESKFNKYAISKAGAVGFMQVMPFWIKEIGVKNQNLLDTQTNIRYGCTILKHYIELEHGNIYYALGRYNGSRGKNTYPALVLNAYQKYWQTQHRSLINDNISYQTYALR